VCVGACKKSKKTKRDVDVIDREAHESMDVPLREERRKQQNLNKRKTRKG
jgi:hypothetical protein